MGTERRKQILLGALMIALALVVYRALATSATSTESTAASNATGANAQSRKAQGAATSAPDVRLEALNVERPKPVETERNLFRFKQKPPPPPPPMARPTGPTMATVPGLPVVPSGPPPPPAITLKFIGVVERSGGKPKIAVLSDGQGPPMHGSEGDTIAGRYRILRIGVESIEMSYLDGRGRQTIRLTGS
jgi:hypothetical protein